MPSLSTFLKSTLAEKIAAMSHLFVHTRLELIGKRVSYISAPLLIELNHLRAEFYLLLDRPKHGSDLHKLRISRQVENVIHDNFKWIRESATKIKVWTYSQELVSGQHWRRFEVAPKLLCHLDSNSQMSSYKAHRNGSALFYYERLGFRHLGRYNLRE